MRIRISTSAIEALAGRVDAAAGIFEQAQFRSINKLAGRAHQRVKREIVSSVNLSEPYVAERLKLHPAEAGRPYAVIIGRSRPTRLVTYGARLVTTSAPRARGDVLRRIASGQKAAGASVQVKRSGARKTLPGAFLIPLRSGKEAGGNGFGVFVRHGSAAHLQAKRNPAIRVGKSPSAGGQLRQLYGPSIDQMFGVLIPGLLPDIQSDMDAMVLREIESDIRRVLAG